MEEARAEKPISTDPPGYRGWTVICVVAILCATIGWLAARLVGFPYYLGYQGTLAQQPLQMAGLSLLALAIALLVSTRIATTLTGSLPHEIGSRLAMLTFIGFSLRGGTMGSVMRAGGDEGIFWLLAGELLAFGILALIAFSLRRVLGGEPEVVDERPGADFAAATTQLICFAVLIWILGRSDMKAQAIAGTFVAGLASSFLSYVIIGRTWKHAWVIPFVVGILGYVANAFGAPGVEIGHPQTKLAPFAMMLPLDYAAMGPLGMAIGELLHGRHREETATETRKAHVWS